MICLQGYCHTSPLWSYKIYLNMHWWNMLRKVWRITKKFWISTSQVCQGPSNDCFQNMRHLASYDSWRHANIADSCKCAATCWVQKTPYQNLMKIKHKTQISKCFPLNTPWIDLKSEYEGTSRRAKKWESHSLLTRTLERCTEWRVPHEIWMWLIM